jgi:hypothetical protein
VNPSRDNEPAIEVLSSTDEPRTRRQLLTAGGVAAIAGVLGAVGISNTAAARDGQFLKAGNKTTATNTTSVQARKGPAFLARVTGGGKVAGLRGLASSTKGTGVQGWADAKKGATIGVDGQTKSANGKAGQFVAANGGTALVAKSPDKKGVALRTEGRLQLTERSGSSSVSGGAEFVIPVAGGLTEKSLVLATLQDHFPGVHVESASVLDTDDGLIVIRLNQAVPEPARVAWIVLD